MQGRCNCGGVVFEVSEPLPGLYQCHCSLCRRQGGAGANAATLVEKEAFAWRAGEELISRWQKMTGFTSHFCRVCGSPLPNPIKDHWMWVPAGLLDKADVKVVAHLHLNSRASWDQPGEAPCMLPSHPQDLEEFIAFLRPSGKSE
ncbi:GFA family protein [Marinospirillum perlucidum]|uniref:GFA family protein n=1 Tax=Marinospirillum perlucidum TaxID=1982602 RepID=UPI000DF4BCAF|nr:GFA family protein [Marinospirillum perlucidum]